MPQNDFTIADQNGVAFLAELNAQLQALVTLSSGASAPATTYAYQLWYDTTAGLLKIRNGANNAWVNIGPLADATKAEIYVNNTKRLDIDTNGNTTITSTGGLKVPSGTTGQRPTPVQGHIRFNSTTGQFEGYDGSAWGSIGGAGNGRVDTFNGTGSQTSFTLTADPGSKNNTIVTISGVVQHKSTYTISGTTITFSPAPPAGTGNIEVMYQTALAAGVPGDGTVTYAKMASAAIATTAEVASGAASKLVDAAGLLPLSAGCNVYQTAATSVPNNAWTTVAFDTEFYDDSTWHDNVTNNSRITFNFTGRANVIANSVITGAGGGNTQGVRILLNGAVIATQRSLEFANCVSVDLAVASGDYVEMQVIQSSGASQNTTTGTTGCRFSAKRIR